ncbi:accessory factor UbiK family protein [Neptuniibacter sp. CAU 1671]|uniref:accessory factor UbiK family protein n=1 Tax=Neptuniibacter sp. CAU 1671 TaxID=3032593 RepID=UPI0023DB00E4|nr:accessory factor UbiK family protein [Neptuniibacter sp. CAU 1671]MDF2182525.1 accessory factor UbiK family protein [Neptuniibacter sp. CAU 1671]
MINQAFIEGLAEQLGQMVSGQTGSTQAQVKQMLQSAFSRLDLVTREEFDAQKAVLQRTREKVDALEAQLAAMQASDSSNS